MDFLSFILLGLALLILSACFSGSETALFSLSLLKRKKLSEKPRGLLIGKHLEHQNDLLITILIGNTLVNVALGSFNSLFLERTWGTSGLMIAVGCSTAFLVLFGEILPKILAINLQEQFALSTIRFIDIFAKVTSPMVMIFRVINKSILLITGTPAKSVTTVSQDEFRSFLHLSPLSTILTGKDRLVIDNILHFGNIKLSQLIVPRPRMVTLSIHCSLAELRATIRDSGFSRIPVYDRDPDDIVGVINAKDVLPALLITTGSRPAPGSFVRPVNFVPEQKNAAEQFKEMVLDKRQISLTLDEYGTVSGLITMEDLIEGLVGEIYDEWDPVNPGIKTLAENRFSVTAELPLLDFNVFFQTHLKGEQAATIGGYILQQTGSMPVRGEKMIIGEFNVTINRVTKTHIENIIITRNVQ